MSPRLAFRCDLGADESVPSWISRLAVYNHAGSAEEFCLDMGMTFQACVDGRPEALAKLSALTGTPLPALKRASITPEEPDYLLRGERLLRTMLRRWKVRVCPVCLWQDMQASVTAGQPKPYGRTLWQLSVFRSCPQHGCALVEVVQNRDRVLHDFTLNINSKRSEIVRWADNPVEQPPSSLETYVADRLEGRTTGAPWLDQLELHVVIGTCETLGVLMTLGAGTSMRTVSDADLHRAGDAGCTVAREGEATILSVFADIHRAHPMQKTTRTIPAAVFGVLYRWLAYDQQRSSYEPVRDLLRRYIMDAMPFGPGDTVIGHAVKARRYHSITSASRETGRDHKRLRYVLAAAGIIGPDHHQWPNHLVIFEAKRAHSVLADEAEGLTLRGVEAYLSISRSTALILAKNNFITPHVKYRGCSKDRRGRHNDQRPSYTRRELDAFLARLLKGAVSVEHPSEHMLAIPAAVAHSWSSVQEIIRLILERKLVWVGRHADVAGFSSVLVDIRELKKVTEGVDDGSLTCTEAQRTLFTSTPVIRALVAGGYLSLRTVMHPTMRRPVQRVDQASFETFRMTYVSLVELARIRNLHPGQVKKALANVPPAIEKQRVGATYYRRDSVRNF